MAETEKNIKNKSKPIFRKLNADDDDPEATVIESLCMNCGKNVCVFNNNFFLLSFLIKMILSKLNNFRGKQEYFSQKYLFTKMLC